MPWQARDTYFNQDSTAICTRNVTPSGDFAIGYNSLGETSGEVKTRFSATFQVTDPQQNPIQGAVITLAGQQYAAGIYRFDALTDGAYDYLIRAAGFIDSSGSFEISGRDTTILVIMNTDNTSVADRMAEHLRVFPNPAREQLTVVFDNAGSRASVLSLLDLHGRQVYQQAFDQSGSITTRIDLQGLAPGVYLLRVVQDGAMTVRKVHIY